MSTLRPLFALFARSLREQSRTKFTSVSRAAIVLIILLFVASNQQSFVNRSAPGLQVLMILAMVNFFTITVFGLSTFPSAITEEKEEDTLGLLQMTQLNPLAILLGKSTARFFEGFLLLAVQLPFTMLCITLGGVAQSQILRTYGILAAYLFLLCNVGLLWSVVCRRTKRAASMTFITGMAIYVLPLFFMGLVYAGRFRWTVSGLMPARPWYQTATEWLLSINPVYDLAQSVLGRSAGIPVAMNSMLPSVVLGTIAFVLAWLLFAPCCNTSGEAVARPPPKTDGRASRRRTVSRPGSLAIAWKDFHFLNGGYKAIAIRIFVYGGLVAAFLMWSGAVFRGMSARTVGETLRAFGLIAFSMELGLTGARIFGVERKRKTLGSIFALPLGVNGIIRQKVLGALPVFIPSVSLIVLGTFLVAVVGLLPRLHDPYRNLELVIFMASECILFAVLVACLSLRMRKAALASAVALMFFGHFLVALTLSDVLRSPIMGAFVIWFFIVFFASRIPERIATAAAEE